MKKIFNKIFNRIPKKVRYTTGIILFLVLVLADAKCSQSIKSEKKMNSVEEIRVIESEKPKEPEPNLETFEDLQSDYEQEGNRTSTAIEEIDDTINNTYEDTEEENKDSGPGDASGKGNKVSGSEDFVRRNKGKTVIIDESDETMKDETKGNKEREYDANQDTQGKLILTKPEEKEGGKEFVNKTKPGGKQGVGVWE